MPSRRRWPRLVGVLGHGGGNWEGMQEADDAEGLRQRCRGSFLSPVTQRAWFRTLVSAGHRSQTAPSRFYGNAFIFFCDQTRCRPAVTAGVPAGPCTSRCQICARSSPRPLPASTDLPSRAGEKVGERLVPVPSRQGHPCPWAGAGSFPPGAAGCEGMVGSREKTPANCRYLPVSQRNGAHVAVLRLTAGPRCHMPVPGALPAPRSCRGCCVPRSGRGDAEEPWSPGSGVVGTVLDGGSSAIPSWFGFFILTKNCFPPAPLIAEGERAPLKLLSGGPFGVPVPSPPAPGAPQPPWDVTSHPAVGWVCTLGPRGHPGPLLLPGWVPAHRVGSALRMPGHGAGAGGGGS